MKRDLSKFWVSVSVGFGIGFLLVTINQIFLLKPFGLLFLENSYLYILLGIGLAQVFILYSPTKRTVNQVTWYDIIFASLSLVVCFYFSYSGEDITSQAWMFSPPNAAVTGSCVVLCFLVLEGVRRAAGFTLFIMCTFFAFYPFFSDRMPSFLEGQSFPLLQTLTFHALDSQSIMGIPLQVVGSLLIGYVIFGAVLMKTGGGQFFLDCSFSLLGRYRGGTGKVAVISSALFGMISGSAVSNVIASGSVTIPAMKRSGFPAHVAGAVEACASTGGVIMPPVMGAAAFIMASFLKIPYIEVAVAAIVPSLLYFLSLYIQLDAYSAIHDIKGLPASDIPPFKKTLAGGWQFLLCVVVLIYFLYLHMEDRAPYFAIVFLLAAVMAKKETRLNGKRFFDVLQSVGQMVGELTVTIAAIGFIIGALALTGTGASLAGELVSLAGGNPYLMLLFGAGASFILGMGMTTSACYIFLAIVLAPGLVSQGFNALAVHFFILYWAMVSNITPPVALACIPAATIAGTSYIKVGMVAVRLGFVKYFVPFIFVLTPAVIFEGPIKDIAYSLLTIFVGVVVISGGLGGYMIGVGKLSLISAALIVILGVSIAWPFGIIVNALAAIGLATTVGILILLKKRSLPSS